MKKSALNVGGGNAFISHLALGFFIWSRLVSYASIFAVAASAQAHFVFINFICVHLKCQWHNHTHTQRRIACAPEHFHKTKLDSELYVSIRAFASKNWFSKPITGCCHWEVHTHIAKRKRFRIFFSQGFVLFLLLFRLYRHSRPHRVVYVYAFGWLTFRFFTVHLAAQSGIHRSRSPFYYTVDCLIVDAAVDIVVGCCMLLFLSRSLTLQSNSFDSTHSLSPSLARTQWALWDGM